MPIRLTLTLAALVLLVTAGVLLTKRPSADGVVLPGSAVPGRSTSTVRDGEGPEDLSITARRPADAPEASEPNRQEFRPREPRGSLVQGVVLDRAGARVPNAEIVDAADPSALLGRADSTGAFAVESRPPVCLAAQVEGCATLLRACVRDASSGEHRIVVGRAIDVAGTVLGPSGSGIADVRVWVRVEPAAFEFADVATDTAQAVERWTITNDRGRFDLSSIPAGPGVTLQVRAPDGAAAEVAVPLEHVRDLVVRLDAVVPPAATIRGRVVHADGAPAAGASVQLGERNVTRCDVDGGFDLVVRPPFDGEALVAYSIGYQPAIERGYGSELSAEPGAVRSERLVLGPPSRTIRGRVEDAEGAPAPGFRIVIAGGGWEATAHQLPPVWIEALIAPDAVVTDVEGRFELRGLRDATYEIEARSPDSPLAVTSGPVAAGASDLVLRIATDAVIARVRGRVVAFDGTPLQGIAVRVVTTRHRSTGLELREGELAVSDGSGAFELTNVPRENLSFRCADPGIVEALIALPAEFDPSAVELRVARKIAVRFSPQSASAREADALRVEDDRGKLRFLHLPGGFGGSELSLTDATTSVISIGEDARTAVLFRAGREVSRVTLRLTGQTPVLVDL